MLWRRQTKCTEVCVAVALLLILHWTQVEASPLKKNIKQNGQKEATEMTDGFQRGIIVFGDPKNESAEVDPSFQADYPGHGGQRDFFSMNPDLSCGSNQMRFSAFGNSVGHFTLKQKPPLPLSQVPPACGYSIEGFPYRLVLNVPFDGCNIDIEGGYYTLPLYWNGYTVKLMCPQPADPTPAPQDPVPQLPPWWYYYYYYYFLHKHQSPLHPWLYYSHSHPFPFPSSPSADPPAPQDPLQYYYHLQKIPFPGLSPAIPPANPLPQLPQKHLQFHHHPLFPQQQVPNIYKYPFDPHKTTTASTTIFCPWCTTATP